MKKFIVVIVFACIVAFGVGLMVYWIVMDDLNLAQTRTKGVEDQLLLVELRVSDLEAAFQRVAALEARVAALMNTEPTAPQPFDTFSNHRESQHEEYAANGHW